MNGNVLRDTNRLEAFSDGVMAIAITLLILDVRLPNDLEPGNLLRQVLLLWPSYLAYLTSFLVILIMWINHHNMFRLIGRVDTPFLMLNGLLLMMITFLNFPTMLVARFIQTDGARTAMIVYGLTSFLIAVLFNGMWYYAAGGGGRLLKESASPALVAGINRSYRFGPLLYLVCVILALFIPEASLALVVGLAIFFAVSTRTTSEAQPVLEDE